MEPFVVAFTGLPGTGKSTLAEAVARATGAPAFASDWLMGSLAPHGVLNGADHATQIAVDHGLLETLFTRQLLLGQSAVTDCLLDDERAAVWRESVTVRGGRFLLVECVCDDLATHRSRIEGRVRGIPGWHEIDWAHVERMRSAFPPLTGERLVADALRPAGVNAALVLAELGLPPGVTVA